MRQRTGIFGSNPNNRFHGGRSHVPSIAKLEEDSRKRSEFESQQAENLAKAKKVRPHVGPRTLRRAVKELARVKKAKANGKRPRRVSKATLETAVALSLKL